MRKWWCQCFTAGISQVVVGLRDDDGLVEEVKTYPVDQLPKLGAVRSQFNLLKKHPTETTCVTFGVLELHAVYIMHGFPPSL